MSVDEYLKQGRMLDQRIRYHMRKLEELRAAACAVSAPRPRQDPVQASPTGDAPFVRTLERIEEMEERIDREICLLMELKEQIEDMIRKLDSWEYQLVLIYRYLEGMTWDEVGEKLAAGRTTLKRWHTKALSLLEMPEDPISIKVGP